ncbi:MAG: tetratricopeptide repeat protein [Pseudomonadota bacterium]
MSSSKTTDTMLREAVQFHQQGQLTQAAAAYRRVLAAEPSQPVALRGLAGLHMQQGDAPGAAQLLHRALKDTPDQPDLLETLGQVQLTQQDFSAAAESFRRCVEVDKERASAWYNLGVAAQQLDTPEDAESAYDQAVALAPGSPQPLNNLANLRFKRKDFSAAADLYRRASAMDTRQPLFRNNLLMALRALAGQQLDQREHAAARENYLEVLRANPDDFASQYNLGLCYRGLGRSDLAADQFRQVVEQHPERTDARQNLGYALRRLGKPSEALTQFQAALEEKPDDPQLLANLAGAAKDLGESAQAMAYYQRALTLAPEDLDIRSNLLLTMNYLDEVTPAELFAAHQAYAEQVHQSTRRPLAQAPKPGSGPVRIGLLSADLRRHSVSYYLEPLLDHLDSERFEVYAYYNHHHHDAVSDRLRARCAGWRVIVGETDEAVARQIADDQIHILIDLSGHSGGNRLPVSAHRPAPLQMTWLGYPNTTGLAAMDYRITDAYTDPPGANEHCYSEKLLRLPRHFSCYSPPAEAPEVSAPPAEQNGYVTFGSFNNLAKVTPRVLKTWAALLRTVPDSRLLLKTRVLADTAVRQRVRDALEKVGVAADRIQLVARDNDADHHLARYGDLDIALDPFPYNGTTTTCEALWCGVPVLTLSGSSHRARVSASMLAGVELEELIASSTEEYVDIGCRLAADRDRLAQLRAGLRERMRASALMDGEGFARDFAAVIESIAPGAA